MSGLKLAHDVKEKCVHTDLQQGKVMVHNEGQMPFCDMARFKSTCLQRIKIKASNVPGEVNWMTLACTVESLVGVLATVVSRVTYAVLLIAVWVTLSTSVLRDWMVKSLNHHHLWFSKWFHNDRQIYCTFPFLK